MSLTTYFADVEVRRNRKTYEEAHRRSIAAGLLLELMFGRQGAPTPPHARHPLHDARLQVYRAEAAKLPRNTPVSVNFGDSMTDLARDRMKSLDGIFSIAGSWHYHMAEMAAAMRDVLQGVDVEWVVVGTLGGNPILIYQDFETTVAESLQALQTIRALYPQARMIVYGLPPVWNIYAANHTVEFDNRMWEWVKADGNAVFVSMKLMGGWMPFFPKVSMSNDGTHLTARGGLRLDTAISKAKTCAPGLVVMA